MSKVLVSDPIDQAGIDILSQVATVDVKTGLKPAELVAIIGEYDALMIRSGTRVTEEIIEAGTQLKIIGRAGVGVDNVDVPTATRKGIVVVNSPEGNTIAAAEHTLAMMLSLSRHIPDANTSLKKGEWDRKTFVGAEIYKKDPRYCWIRKNRFPCSPCGQSHGHETIGLRSFYFYRKGRTNRLSASRSRPTFSTSGLYHPTYSQNTGNNQLN